MLGLRKSKQSAASSWIAAREWRLGEKIGSGSFGDVFMGLNNKVRTSQKKLESYHLTSKYSSGKAIRSEEDEYQRQDFRSE